MDGGLSRRGWDGGLGPQEGVSVKEYNGLRIKYLNTKWTDSTRKVMESRSVTVLMVLTKRA